MAQQVLDLVKRAAQASIKYVAMAGAALVAITLLSKIPYVGGLFVCVNVIGLLAIAFGIGYLVTPQIPNLPGGQSKPLLALWIGIGIAVPLTIAVVVAGLVGNLFDVLINSYTLLGGIFHIVGGLFVGLIGTVLIGTALAWLGSFFSLDRNPYMAGVQGPPAAGRPF